MCGIAVVINWDNAEDAVKRLTGGILHRGDITDPVVTPRAKTAMATRRLRIVDPALGQQPGSSFDGMILVSFNGEIYNHKILRAELEGLGITFRTGSDTEVLANALRAWGGAALSRLSACSLSWRWTCAMANSWRRAIRSASSRSMSFSRAMAFCSVLK